MPGQLVAPFAVHHPNTAGWYFVYPKRTIVSRRITVFKEWLMTEAALMQAQLNAEIQ